MAMNFDKQRFEDTYVILQKGGNEQVIERVQNLANVLTPLAGSNSMIDKVLVQCKKVQEFYNDQYRETLQAVLHDFSELEIVAEKIAAAEKVSDVSLGSIEYQKSGIDASEII